MKLYHATFNSYLPEIQAQGLVSGPNKNWLDCASGYVYLADDMDVAISFCEAVEDTPDDVLSSGICCLEIDSDYLDFNALFDDPNILVEKDEISGCFAYSGKIPFNALRLCWTEELGHIRPQLSEQILSAVERQTALLSRTSGQAKTLDDKIQSASNRAAASKVSSNIKVKEAEPEL